MIEYGENGRIPYETIVQAIVDTDDSSLTKWVKEVFPECTEAQLEKARHNIMCTLHDGIVMGFSMTDSERMTVFEAYQLSLTEGFDRASGNS